MRTRLLRPEFWADSRMADLPAECRLTYMGLWCLADDDGYFIWSVRDIAAELYRYESPKRRESKVERHIADLLTADRIKRLECLVHGLIPSLPRYRIKGGTQTTSIHRVHTESCLVRTSTDRSLSVSGSLTDTLTGSSSGSRSGLGAGRGAAAQERGSKEPSTKYPWEKAALA